MTEAACPTRVSVCEPAGTAGAAAARTGDERPTRLGDEARLEREGRHETICELRRRLCRTTAFGLAAALLVPLGGCAEPIGMRVAKAEANYTDPSPSERRCTDCINFIARDNACRRVDGAIAAGAWCKYFVSRMP